MTFIHDLQNNDSCFPEPQGYSPHELGFFKLDLTKPPGRSAGDEDAQTPLYDGKIEILKAHERPSQDNNLEGG